MTDSQDYFFPQSLPLFLSHSLSHTNTNQRTSAITPEITSLIDISITLRHSCVLSCLAHTPPVPILNCSMDAPTKNEVTLLFPPPPLVWWSFFPQAFVYRIILCLCEFPLCLHSPKCAQLYGW